MGPVALHRTVKTLGLVSLLNDASSEMIFPLLPAFLTTTLGAGPAFLGLVEGIAEAVASLLKVASGALSDRLPRRKPLMVAGYALASLTRPLIAFAASAWHLLLIRFLDRVGKGIRGAPRDALIAEVTPAEDRGRAYGFHRAMDHAGALVGPLLASAVLLVTPDLRTVFLCAAVPAVLSLLVLGAGVGEQARPVAPRAAVTPTATPLGRRFWLYLGVLSVFTLGNSSDAFLLLKAQQAGVPLAAIPLLWSFHHLVKSSASTHGGMVSDRVGRRAAILAGWCVYGCAYAVFALATTPLHAVVAFAVYGLYHALTEGPERALVADLAGAEARGRAFGLYHGITGALLLPASLLTGWLWQAFSPGVALGAGAGLAGLAALGLLGLVPGSGPAARQ